MVMPIILSIFLLFLGIGVLITVHVCIVGRALRRGVAGDTLNTTATVDSGQNITSVSGVDLEKLPCFDYAVGKETTLRFEAADCAVCLEAFEAGQKCRVLALCKHVFHAHCVDVWLLRKPFCPICRASAEETTGIGCRSASSHC